jgi:hypothetical protein
MASPVTAVLDVEEPVVAGAGLGELLDVLTRHLW